MDFVFKKATTIKYALLVCFLLWTTYLYGLRIQKKNIDSTLHVEQVQEFVADSEATRVRSPLDNSRYS